MRRAFEKPEYKPHHPGTALISKSHHDAQIMILSASQTPTTKTVLVSGARTAFGRSLIAYGGLLPAARPRIAALPLSGPRPGAQLAFYTSAAFVQGAALLPKTAGRCSWAVTAEARPVGVSIPQTTPRHGGRYRVRWCGGNGHQVL